MTRIKAPVSAPVTVLGLGNLLMGDDGFGPEVVSRLQSTYEFPPQVTVIDAGAPGPNLASLLEDVGALIVVDAVRDGSPPGTLRFFRDRELQNMPGPRLSPHEPALEETLALLEFHGKAPAHVLLLGAVPLCVGTGVGLSRPVRDCIPRAVEAVIRELRRLGFECREGRLGSSRDPTQASTAIPESARNSRSVKNRQGGSLASKY